MPATWRIPAARSYRKDDSRERAAAEVVLELGVVRSCEYNPHPDPYCIPAVTAGPESPA